MGTAAADTTRATTTTAAATTQAATTQPAVTTTRNGQCPAYTPCNCKSNAIAVNSTTSEGCTFCSCMAVGPTSSSTTTSTFAPGTFLVQGIAADNNGIGLRDVAVTFLGPEQASAITGSDGYFILVLTGSSTQPYTVVFSKNGYQNEVRQVLVTGETSITVTMDRE